MKKRELREQLAAALAREQETRAELAKAYDRGYSAGRRAGARRQTKDARR